MEQRNLFEQVKRHSVKIIAILVMLFSAWIAIRYMHQPLLEKYASRQTQTALTAYWMIQEGWQLAYQTPVVGYPWAIPFEFPIYQTLAAFVAWVTNFNLDAAGRIVSYLFLLATTIPAVKIRKKLDLPKEVLWIFLALLWSSPLYLFWARTFMIETSAVFFTIFALSYGLDLLDEHPSWRSVFLFSLWGSLAALQKVTTGVPMMLVLGGVIALDFFYKKGIACPSLRKLSTVFVSFFIPLIVTINWSWYTDAVRGKNEFGMQLTSSVLREFIFGTLRQRLSTEMLQEIFLKRVAWENLAGGIGLMLIIIVLFWGRKATRRIVFVSLVLFLVPILIFFNLHWRHTYYQTSSVIFLIFAFSISVYEISERNSYFPKGKSLPIILLFLVSVNLFFFHKGEELLVKQEFNIANKFLAVGEFIQTNTPKDSGIIIFGDGWRSKIPYYSQRKAFAVHREAKNYGSVWENPEDYLGELDLGAVVYRPLPNQKESLSFESIVTRYVQSSTAANLFYVAGCYVWLPEKNIAELPQNGNSIKAMHFIGTLSPEIPRAYTLAESINCTARINEIDQQWPLPPDATISNLIEVRGWFVMSWKNGRTPDDVFVTLTDNNGAIQYIQAASIPRYDTQNIFGEMGMFDNVGFLTITDISEVPDGEYHIGLARGYQQKIRHCNQFSYPIIISKKER